MDEQRRVTAAAIVRSDLDEESMLIGDASIAELLMVASARIEAKREALASEDRVTAGPIAREFSIAITHIEDAITRANKGVYREKGMFAVTDAERTRAEPRS